MSAKTPTQYERLVAAMIELCAQGGYPSVSAAALAARAGVSTETLYDQFGGKEGCLVAAYNAATQALFGQMYDAFDAGAPIDVALDALLAAVQAHPDDARVYLFDAPAAGPWLRRRHEKNLEELERRLEQVLEHRSLPGGRTLDLPATAIVGALRSIVANRLLGREEDLVASLTEDFLRWLSSYASSNDAARWSTGPRCLLERPPRPPASAPAGCIPLPAGRNRLPTSMVARNQRMRLLQATAELMIAKGYASTTVTDIVACARVSREIFYGHFTGKQEAFLEAQRQDARRTLDACATAYFTAEEWPERVWAGMHELIGLIVRNPAPWWLRLVECYAAGPLAIRRTEAIAGRLSLFLEEGYRCNADGQQPPRLCSEAIAGALLEVIRRHVARRDHVGLEMRLPQLVYVAIAPFTGREQAVRLVEQMGAERSARHQALNTDSSIVSV